MGKLILSPINDDGKNGCKIEWSFVCDPIEGLKFEDFLPYIETGLQSMAKKMEDALLFTRCNLKVSKFFQKNKKYKLVHEKRGRFLFLFLFLKQKRGMF